MNSLEKIYLDALNIYLFDISYLSKRPGERNKSVDFFIDVNTDKYAVLEAYVSNRACLLTRCNELINSLNPRVGTELEKLIDRSVRFQQINWKINTQNKRVSYRNSLAHGRFLLNPDTGVVHVDNTEFEAELPFYEFSSLTRLYYVAYMKLRDNYLDFCISNLKAIDNIKKSRTIEMADGILNVKVLADSEYNRNNYLKYVDDRVKKELKKTMEAVGDNYTPKGTILTETQDFSTLFHCQQLSDIKQIELLNYIEYIADWDKLSKSEKYQYIRNFVSNQLGNSILPIEYEEINALILPFAEFFKDTSMPLDRQGEFFNTINDTLGKIGWKPSVGYKAYGYIINVINAVYFCFGYLAERYRDQYPDLFKGYDLSAFDPDETVGISGLNNYLTIISSRTTKLKEEKRKQKNSSLAIENYTKLNKEAQRQREQDIFDKRQLKIDQYQKEIDDATYFSKDVRNDEEAFMKKIRNSLTHGFFTIDYDSGFSINDVTRTLITFEDIDTRNGNKVTLRATIMARDLVYMLKQFREKLAKELGEELSNKKIVYGLNRIKIEDI